QPMPPTILSRRKRRNNKACSKKCVKARGACHGLFVLLRQGCPGSPTNTGEHLKKIGNNHDAEFARARRHLARRDPVLRRLIARIGACTLRINPDGFQVLARSIISQQISWKAALSIGNRLSECLGKGGLCPAAIVRASETKLRAAGLSANKMRALKDLAG